MKSTIFHVEKISSFSFSLRSCETIAMIENRFNRLLERNWKVRMFAFPDLILFQGRGSLAAGSRQSYLHTFHQVCKQILARLYIFWSLRSLLIGNSVIKPQKQKLLTNLHTILIRPCYYSLSDCTVTNDITLKSCK